MDILYAIGCSVYISNCGYHIKLNSRSVNVTTPICLDASISHSKHSWKRVWCCSEQTKKVELAHRGDAHLAISILQVIAGAFQRLEQNGVSPILMPAIGGLVTGVMACQYPEVLYQGFGNVNAILQNRESFAPPLLFQILAVKIFVTSVSKGSGLVGGAYAPSIFMGMSGNP